MSEMMWWRDVDSHARLVAAVSDLTGWLGYLDEGERGDDDLTPEGYGECADAVRRSLRVLKDADAALKLCVPILRGELANMIESEVAWTLASLERHGNPETIQTEKLRCIKTAVSEPPEGQKYNGWEELRLMLQPLLVALRAAQAITGRPNDKREWLDAVINGEAGI